LVQPCPCLVPDSSVLYAVPFLHGGSSHLQAATNYFRDPSLPWVRFCSCPQRSTARCQSPYRFFSALTVFTAASSLGTSSCTATKFFFWVCLQLRGLRLS
jgi:hypothetical protein